MLTVKYNKLIPNMQQLSQGQVVSNQPRLRSQFVLLSARMPEQECQKLRHQLKAQSCSGCGKLVQRELLAC